MMKKGIVQDTVYYDEIYSPSLHLSQLTMTEQLEISMVIEGCGIHRILNEPTECRVGDIYILNSGVAHGYFAKSELECPKVLVLKFDPKQWFQGEWADASSMHYCYGVFREKSPIAYALLNSKALSRVKDIMHMLGEEICTRDMEWESAVAANLELLMITLGRYMNLADTVGTQHPKEWTIVSATMREVLDRYGESDMTLESIAQSLLISKSYLSKLFQKVAGVTFQDYVRSVRVRQACILLQTTDWNNEEIVSRCGLKDIPSFYRLFKDTMGMTPHQYRKSRGVIAMSIMEISENLQRGKAKIVKELVEQALQDGVPAAQILNEGLLGGMNIIGEKFKNNEVYVPEVLVAARAMNTGLQVLKPLLIEDGVQATGKVCIGTVQGDMHDIGKNLVKMMMEGKGLEVIDLGTDVAPETFVQTAIEQECQIICCSALLTTTMDVMADVVKCAEAAGIRDKVKIMVGGAPVTDEFCQKIGADRYTSDAASAADAAVELCQA